eukprot:965242_1
MAEPTRHLKHKKSLPYVLCVEGNIGSGSFHHILSTFCPNLHHSLSDKPRLSTISYPTSTNHHTKGKSTLLSNLSARGFTVIEEPVNDIWYVYMAMHSLLPIIHHIHNKGPIPTTIV